MLLSQAILSEGRCEMGKRVIYFIAAMFSSVLVLSKTATPVPAFSMEEEVEGTVVAITVMRAEVVGVKPSGMVLYRLTVKPRNKPARMGSRKYLRVYSKRPIPFWVFGRRVELVIRYSGDEWGGNYWLKKIKEVE
jgi:hypothetical protein